MSEVSNVLQKTNALITNYDLSKFLLGENYFTEGELTASGSDVNLKQGMVMGRVASTGKLKALDPTATDGSQYPVGLAIIDQTITDGDTETVSIVNKGLVDYDTINIISGALTDTVGPDDNKRRIIDLIRDLGIIDREGLELTDYDNS
jgi:hypothetical protein